MALMPTRRGPITGQVPPQRAALRRMMAQPAESAQPQEETSGWVKVITPVATLAGAGIGALAGNPVLGAQLGSAAGGMAQGALEKDPVKAATSAVSGTMAGVEASQAADAATATTDATGAAGQFSGGAAPGEMATEDTLLKQLAKRRAAGLVPPRG